MTIARIEDVAALAQAFGQDIKQAEARLDRTGPTPQDFGARGNGSNDTAAINAAAAASNDVRFPPATYSWTFTPPPWGSVWRFEGETTRQQIGGASNAVRFRKATLAYLDGPHPNDQLQAEHIRAIAKGSGAIGAQYADYGLGITVEKANWSRPDGGPDAPVAGEINALTMFLRQGAETGDPVKTGGAAILGNVGQTEGCGYMQFAEVVNTTFAKGTLAPTRQTNLQLLGIDERDNLSYGVILNSVTGTQTGAFRVAGTDAAPWGYILENYKSSRLNFRISDIGAMRWRDGSLAVSMTPDPATGALVFRNEAGDEVGRIGQNGFAHRQPVVVRTGTAETITGADTGNLIVLANAAAITATLSASAPVGTVVEVLQRDPGQVTFAPASGAALRHRQGHTKTAGTYARARLEVVANAGNVAVWYLSGDTAA